MRCVRWVSFAQQPSQVRPANERCFVQLSSVPDKSCGQRMTLPLELFLSDDAAVWSAWEPNRQKMIRSLVCAALAVAELLLPCGAAGKPTAMGLLQICAQYSCMHAPKPILTILVHNTLSFFLSILVVWHCSHLELLGGRQPWLC